MFHAQKAEATKFCKNKLRSQLTDDHLGDILLLSSSSTEPIIASIFKYMLHHVSHKAYDIFKKIFSVILVSFDIVCFLEPLKPVATGAFSPNFFVPLQMLLCHEKCFKHIIIAKIFPHKIYFPPPNFKNLTTVLVPLEWLSRPKRLLTAASSGNYDR